MASSSSLSPSLVADTESCEAATFGASCTNSFLAAFFSAS
eukprot:CAMPEP_0173390170 /NCGR_PEP_ID=MMETSP1356-20130122/14338_1 /TAXON_ID=77927 ORGANISM="Hemiselmis virescens, Strain PCC157" /NCGR_SAMPLE_ID=MMETSP1356 /ASSEMBLY_ACC=CAM_ASM_000847 /LENGTH=39 /DNA_ID= /DNA_START= /DNA_END= /DNA_ORIENTATION=